MKATFNTLDIPGHTGYGNAGRGLQQALELHGVEWDEQAELVLNFCMPTFYKKSNISIGYTPWESTELPDGWIEKMAEMDDLWSTSHFSAKVIAQATDRPVFVLPHGLDSFFFPLQRCRREPFVFLHIGEPATRKGGDIVLEAWHKHFQYDKNVKLVMKAIGHTQARVYDRDGSIIGSIVSYNNAKLITHVANDRELRDLYWNSDCLVYPTRGEGFGLIPFEAIGAGLPTILPGLGGTAEFSQFGYALKESRAVLSDAVEHPGYWLDHSLDEVIYLMEYIYKNYETVSIEAFSNACGLARKFSWESIADAAMDRIGTLL